MELRDYIDMGAKKAGSLTALAKMLEMSQPTISGVRAHKRPLPDMQLIQLAEYLGVNERELIAANNIAMGKHVEFWRPFVMRTAHTVRHAAVMAGLAIVTNFVTPAPAEASNGEACEQTSTRTFCIMSSRRKKLKQGQLHRSMQILAESIMEFIKAALTSRALEMKPV